MAQNYLVHNAPQHIDVNHKTNIYVLVYEHKNPFRSKYEYVYLFLDFERVCLNVNCSRYHSSEFKRSMFDEITQWKASYFAIYLEYENSWKTNAMVLVDQ